MLVAICFAVFAVASVFNWYSVWCWHKRYEQRPIIPLVGGAAGLAGGLLAGSPVLGLFCLASDPGVLVVLIRMFPGKA